MPTPTASTAAISSGTTPAVTVSFTTLEKPWGAYPDVVPYGIDGSNIVGYYYTNAYFDYDTNARGIHGFIYDGTTYTTIDVPGASYTEVYGIDGGNIIGTYYDDVGRSRGFLTTFAEQPPIVLFSADFDEDGDVDGTDFLLWQAGYPTSTGATHLLGDADYDGDVDGIDFLFWQRNFPYPTALSSVPEPNSLALLAIGGLMMLRRRTTR